MTETTTNVFDAEDTETSEGATPSPDDRLLKVAIGRNLIDKIPPESLTAFATDGWENVELRVAELIAEILAGFAYCAQFRGRRATTNFKAADIVSVDIDRGLSIQDALDLPIVRDHAAFLYTTPSHTPEDARFRIVFVLPQTIETANEMRAISRSLALRLGGDLAATDACRISFGNSKAEIYSVGKMLSAALVQELIDQNIDAPEKVDREHSYRSRLTVEPSHPVRTERGAIVPFAYLNHGDRVFCPYHNDENASAFVVRSGKGTLGMHCSTCQLTYWPASSDDDDFEEFEKAARAAAEGVLSRAFEGVSVTVGTEITTPTHLVKPLTLVKAPKGSGKTEGLVGLISGPMKALLIGHRRLLNKQSAPRLGLHSYLDRDNPQPWRGGKDGRLKRFAVSVDSLALIPSNSDYDVVIIDESEQVLSHFLSETIGDSREDLFKAFENLCRRAKHVIALDADLGWMSFYVLWLMKFGAPGSEGSRSIPTVDEFKTAEVESSLEPLMGDDDRSRSARSRLIINTTRTGDGKKLEVYSSRNHLVGELMSSLADGKCCVVVSNSKDGLGKLDLVIRQKLPTIRALLITSDTNNDPAVQRFIANPASEFENYDVVLASPTMGTGVDITFPSKEERVDVVFGICEANITTHLDFDQQLGRVRHPKAVKVWLSPQIFHYETSTDVVKRDVLGNGLFRGRIERYTSEGEPIYRSGDLLFEMAALSVSQRRASMNRIKANFIRHKERDGFSVVHVETDSGQAEVGSSMLELGSVLQKEEYAERVERATTLTKADFNDLATAANNGKALSEAQRWSLERTRIELFYRALATKGLVLQDEKGKLRRQVRLFEEIQNALKNPFATEGNGSLFTARDRFLRERPRQIRAITALLRATPLFDGSGLRVDAEIQGADLAEFVKLVVGEKATLETQLDLEMRSDAATKPIQQLNIILAQLGLKMIPVRSGNVKGTKIRYYSLDPDGLTRLEAIIAARRAISGWHALAVIHGWSPDDEELDQHDFDGSR